MITLTLNEKQLAELVPCNIPERDHSDLPPIGWNYPHMRILGKSRTGCVFTGNGVTIEVPMLSIDSVDLPVDKEYILTLEHDRLTIRIQT